METKSLKSGLFFGSFNPIHIGHLIIANYLVSQSDLDEVWFVVSPQNPLKSRSGLAPEYSRLRMVQLAIADNPRLMASDVEFSLDRPSYTVDTLQFLRQNYTEKQFALIMGGDNLAIFPKWKGHKEILQYHEVYVYARPGADPGKWTQHPRVRLYTAMQMNISATHIRNCIQAGQSIRYLTPDNVIAYIRSEQLYQNSTGPLLDS